MKANFIYANGVKSSSPSIPEAQIGYVSETDKP